MNMFMLDVLKKLPEPLRSRALFRLGTAMVPMIGFLRPRLIELTQDRTVVRVNVSRRSRNTYHSLFIGAFSTMGDCVAGLYPMKYMFETGFRTMPIMKTAHAEYYRRVTHHALFTCTQGQEIYALCDRAVTSGERLELPVTIVVTAPQEYGDEPVAKIVQVLSVKNLSSTR